MRKELPLKKPEPWEAVVHHPVAAAVGGVLSALFCGYIGAAGASPAVGVLMAAFGLLIGAPGGAFVADSAERANRI
jgi:hypothetical protein